MSYIEFCGIQKNYGRQQVLKGLSFSVEQGQFVTLLGASGCGKSTLLRLLAGLDTVTEGQLFLDGEDITYKPASLREIGMIFQQYSLFPTMDVFQNVSFGPRMKHVSRDHVEELVLEALRIVDLVGSERKFPSQLSGGEQQRVALARAIVTKPKVLLLDEPFSAIDAKLRKSLQSRIKEIHKSLGMTSLFVTHDQDEAMVLSDQVFLMNDGCIEQRANPLELYAKPTSHFAASFMGSYNLIEGQVFADLLDGRRVSGTSEVEKVNVVAIRPEQIQISTELAGLKSQEITMDGSILSRTPMGNIIRYEVQSKGHSFTVDTLFDSEVFYEENQEVIIGFDERCIITLDK